jgi:hypothetical protein
MTLQQPMKRRVHRLSVQSESFFEVPNQPSALARELRNLTQDTLKIITSRLQGDQDRQTFELQQLVWNILGLFHPDSFRKTQFRPYSTPDLRIGVRAIREHIVETLINARGLASLIVANLANQQNIAKCTAKGWGKKGCRVGGRQGAGPSSLPQSDGIGWPQMKVEVRLEWETLSVLVVFMKFKT